MSSVLLTSVDKKNENVKFDIILKEDEEYKSVTHGCIRFIDTFWFLSSSLDSLVKTLIDNKQKTLEIMKKNCQMW